MSCDWTQFTHGWRAYKRDVGARNYERILFIRIVIRPIEYDRIPAARRVQCARPGGARPDRTVTRGPATDRRGPRARSTAARGTRATLCDVRRFVVFRPYSAPRPARTLDASADRRSCSPNESNPELRERRRGEVANPGPGADPRKLELIGSARGSGGMIR